MDSAHEYRVVKFDSIYQIQIIHKHLLASGFLPCSDFVYFFNTAKRIYKRPL